ncbi:LytR/AlgR family response regulator transcription factor [Inhella proteolytica]|uniref:Response regulator transcription factor n=1 Tax=Inhella proteolytica TaxID=2795029 RepID=A0A931J437_9BURK|nr:LytTR family DNA-binding domain-containing protein [Inhella proteolytica]MBH9579246.1 response regulator transcription factor [Inhella proteolytica]
MTTKTVLICEDEPLARETLRDFLAPWPALRLLGEACDGREALERIEALKPELVFMDIQMPELTGLEVLQRLQHRPALIFTTAYDQHAVTAFELNAVDYLLKPFTRERFDAAVQRVLAEEEAAPADTLVRVLGGGQGPLTRILVRDRGHIFPLAVERIEHLKSDAKYTLITSGGQQYVVRVPLQELEQRLDPSRFLRIHRSAMVNLDFVDSMQADEQSQLELLMRDGTRLLANREVSRLLRGLAL